MNEDQKKFQAFWSNLNRKGKRDFVKKVIHSKGLTGGRVV